MDNMLTLDQLDDMLYSGDDRVPKGWYNATIITFARSGQHFINMSELDVLRTKKAPAIKASCVRVLADLNEKYRDMPACKIGKSGNNILLVNVAVHSALKAKAAAEKAAAEAENTNDDES